MIISSNCHCCKRESQYCSTCHPEWVRCDACCVSCFYSTTERKWIAGHGCPGPTVQKPNRTTSCDSEDDHDESGCQCFDYPFPM